MIKFCNICNGAGVVPRSLGNLRPDLNKVICPNCKGKGYWDLPLVPGTREK